MFDSLDDILNAFKQHLILSVGNSNSALDQYFPKIRDTLVPYLKNKFQNNTDYTRVEDFLKHVGLSILAECAVRDIKRVYENKGTVSEKALDNFIIAFRQFFDFLMDNGIDNHGIMVFFSKNPIRNKDMTNIRNKIKKELLKSGIELQEAKKDPPLAKDCDGIEFKHLCCEINKIDSSWDSLDLTRKQSVYKFQYSIMVKLFLLLGLKPQKLYDIKLKDYDERHCQLNISNFNYCVQLPNVMSDQLFKLKEFRIKQGYSDNNYLLITQDGKSVDESHLPYYLNKIKSSFFEKFKITSDYPNGENPFTQTGLMKFGIIQMIKQGMHPHIIREITGVESDIYEDCLMVELSSIDDYKSRHFNSYLRLVPTYDLFNALNNPKSKKED